MTAFKKSLPKEFRCKKVYRLKVKSKKTGRWEFQMYGCSLRSMKTAVQIYKDKFGKQAKIVLA